MVGIEFLALRDNSYELEAIAERGPVPVPGCLFHRLPSADVIVGVFFAIGSKA